MTETQINLERKTEKILNKSKCSSIANAALHTLASRHLTCYDNQDTNAYTERMHMAEMIRANVQSAAWQELLYLYRIVVQCETYTVLIFVGLCDDSIYHLLCTDNWVHHQTWKIKTTDAFGHFGSVFEERFSKIETLDCEIEVLLINHFE